MSIFDYFQTKPIDENELKYKKELNTLHNLGFKNKEENLKSLLDADGDINKAFDTFDNLSYEQKSKIQIYRDIVKLNLLAKNMLTTLEKKS